ncbi:MAG: hypothetical protein ABUL61_01685, partial [Oleiharenicola lentus]
MKLRILFLLAALVTRSLLAQENLDKAMDRAVLDYTERLRQASAELTATRERIAREKEPLLIAQRAAEDRLLAAESGITRFETFSETAETTRRRLVKDAESLHKNGSYMNSLAQDSLRAYGSSLAPGEDQFQSARVGELEAALGDQARATGGQAAADTAEFLLARVKQSLGGYTAAGSSLVGEGNEVRAGTFAFVGPQAYFRSAQGEAGVV